MGKIYHGQRCKNCGRIYSGHGRIYCSNNCRIKGRTIANLLSGGRKICSKCKQIKPVSEFYKYQTIRGGKYFASCKSCWAKLQGHDYLKETKRKCRWCGAEFTPTRSARWHCSSECFKKHSLMRGRKSHNFLRKKAIGNFYKKELWRTLRPQHTYTGSFGYWYCIFNTYVHIQEHRWLMMKKIG